MSKKAAAAKFDEALANEVNKVSIEETTGALLHQMAIMAPYLIVVTALAAGIFLAYKNWNKEAEAAEQASKNAAEAKKHYDNLKTSLDNIKTALDNLHTAEDNLDSLTKGTQEWRDALQ